jgi:hypothetical protein
VLGRTELLIGHSITAAKLQRSKSIAIDRIFGFDSAVTRRRQSGKMRRIPCHWSILWRTSIHLMGKLHVHHPLLDGIQSKLATHFGPSADSGASRHVSVTDLPIKPSTRSQRLKVKPVKEKTTRVKAANLAEPCVDTTSTSGHEGNRPKMKTHLFS